MGIFDEQPYAPEKISGIFLAVPTGKVHEDDPQYIQVSLPNEITFYARPCYAFPLMAAPSEQWLQKYKDEVRVWIMYAHNNPDYPVWMGFTFIDGKATDADTFPQRGTIKTEKFLIDFNDKDNKLLIQQRDSSNTITQQLVMDGDKFYIANDKKLFLTSDNPGQYAVLGNKWKDIMGELIDAIKALTVSSATGPSGTPINFAQFDTIKNKLDSILSTIVKLD